MFPHAAGLIVELTLCLVNDIMKLPGANENDKKLFAQYKHARRAAAGPHLQRAHQRAAVDLSPVI